MRELCGNVIEAAQNSAMHIAIFVVRRPADDAAGDYAAVRLGDEPPGDRDEGDRKVN